MPEEHDERWKELATDRIRALMELGRHEELLKAVRERKAVGTEAERLMFIGVEGQALYYMGQFEEALDVLRSAELDEVLRVWFFRSLAYAKLGHKAEALDSYYQYE